METSAFMDKEICPDSKQLAAVLGDKLKWWEEIRNYTFQKYPQAKEEWNFPGKKYGWSFRIKDRKRAIVYLLPRVDSFKAAFVFGKKATDAVLSSRVDQQIKQELLAARIYAEGRGISILVDDSELIKNISTLIDIKLSY